MGTWPDEGVVAKIATNISRNHFSVNTFAVYEKLRLARGCSLPPLIGVLLILPATCHVDFGE